MDVPNPPHSARNRIEARSANHLFLLYILNLAKSR